LKILHWLKQKKIVWFLLVGFIFMLPRGLELDRFVTTDETPWLMRSGNFYYALGQRDFIKTDQGINPGVTTMWVNTAAFLLEVPEYRGFGQGYFKHYVDFDRFVLSKNIDAHQILVTGRKLMLVENLVLFLIAFGFSIKLVGLLPSLTGFVLLTLDPFHIALTRVSHMDGQLSSLMMVSFLAFLVYQRHGQQRTPLVISAITASLACLTKLPAYVLLPVFGVIYLATVIQHWKLSKVSPGLFCPWVKRCFKHALLFTGIFIAVYIALWPAMWVSPVKTLVDQVAAPFLFLPEEEDGTEDGLGVVSQAENTGASDLVRKMKYYPESILWQTTPIVVFGLAAAIITFIRQKGFFSQKTNQNAGYLFLLFILLYEGTVTLVDKRNPRYIIPAYSMLVQLAGFGVLSITMMIYGIKRKWVKGLLVAVLTASIIYFQIIPVFSSYPYFYSYYNPLMGGSRKAGISRFVGSGEGLDEAARYLNTKTNAQNLTAMSWYGSGCFSYFFSGTTIIIPTAIGDGYIYDNTGKADYLVVYNNQWRRQIPPELFATLSTITPEKTIWINDIEYARIYEISALPSSYLNKNK
jgi:hypothetical protein